MKKVNSLGALGTQGIPRVINLNSTKVETFCQI